MRAAILKELLDFLVRFQGHEDRGVMLARGHFVHLPAALPLRGRSSGRHVLLGAGWPRFREPRPKRG